MNVDGGGGGIKEAVGVSPDSAIKNRMMLRFRPIAPKPATGSGGSPTVELREWSIGSGRRKRRYVRVCGSRKGNAARREKKPSGDNRVRRSDQEKAKTARLVPGERPGEARPLDLKIGQIERPEMGVAESWVTVLRVTEACMDWGGLGCTDEEKWRNLAEDTCPGFICDADNHVVWSNAAYRRMVAGGGSDMAVRLVLDESVLMLPVESPAFACMVRVQSTWQQERATVVPCDVWRMGYGGYAWRLDVNAGLSLGWSCIH